AFATLPPLLGGTTFVNLGVFGLGNIALEGANETHFCRGSHCVSNTPFDPLTGTEISDLLFKAPQLAGSLLSYQVQFVDQHGAVVGPTSAHKVGTIITPVLNANPNFDTVVLRLDPLVFTGVGEVFETPITIAMLNLQSVNPLLIFGFHYELLVTLLNGPVDPQFTGNIKLDSTAINSSGGVFGTVDMGVTGPAPTTANLGANLPSGMEGLPVNFDIQFIPLDGGPSLPSQNGESIFQNPTLGTFGPTPEPSTFGLLAIGGAVMWLASRRRRAS
ncbi:MAG TPA: PEP-CTERM sorting domain-containing protein, partial [Candidatus Sulfopaludibacter sp.]|nr:PEP-CTERM sorting domain-containing protein [Candidatus Sulfopaludibacter sp.]